MIKNKHVAEVLVSLPELDVLQKLSLDDSRASGMRSVSERSVVSPVSTQSPATHENSNVVIYEVRQSVCFT